MPDCVSDHETKYVYWSLDSMYFRAIKQWQASCFSRIASTSALVVLSQPVVAVLLTRYSRGIVVGL